MSSFTIEQAATSFQPYCDGESCRRSGGIRIVDGSMAYIRFGRENFYYCRSCAPKLLEQLKPILNSDLWVFG